ncbi:MAG TPA: Wzt carbohydrate-binding domain-containing protein, partial [bacterium]|nr:Wzt carbohydrate-binding domain-containing protein [bacterium]
VFQTGEDLVFEIHFKTRGTVENAVFGVGLYLQDGTWCFGSNTQIERMRIREINGEGWLRLVFPEMPLIENSYLINVAVHGEDQTPFDFHSKMYRVAFRSDQGDSGIFRPGHHWEFSDNMKIETIGSNADDSGEESTGRGARDE